MADPGSPLILIVDDDEGVAALVKEALQDLGGRLLSAGSLFRAWGLLRRAVPDLIILDRRLPDGDGADFCAQLRKNARTSGVPVLFMSGTRKEVSERVRGLDAGGDDYLAKPFSVEELRARVRALLRRFRETPAAKAPLEAGGLRLDLDSRKAYLDERELHLGLKEHELLRVFLECRGRVLSREFLLERIWGLKAAKLSSNALDVAICGLRAKLGRRARQIVTVRGLGLRFEPEV